MNIYEREIINILKSSLENPDKKYIVNKEIDIENLFSEAREHCIDGTIYYYINKDNLKLNNKELILNMVTQNQINRNVDDILNCLGKENIKIILLKGIVLSSYYPNREIRSMGDVDILVRDEDYPKVREFFIKHGFNEDSGHHDIHKEFSLNRFINFEVHWNLINPKFYKIDTDKFLKDIWDNSKVYLNENLRCIDANNNIIYLLLHMLIHIKYSGFGLRQFYDLALFLDKEKDNIDYNYIIEKSKYYNIDFFVVYMFNAINRVLKEVVPKEIVDLYNISDENIDLLINNILLSGVHGRKNEIKGYENVMRYGQDIYTKRLPQKIFRVYFPHRDSLGDEYRYTLKHPITTPYGLIHYAFKKGVIKEYGFKGSLINLKKALKIRKIRVSLIKEMKIV